MRFLRWSRVVFKAGMLIGVLGGVGGAREWEPMEVGENVSLINMHYPEMWGTVQFSTKVVGEGEEAFVMRPEEETKKILRSLKGGSP